LNGELKKHLDKYIRILRLTLAGTTCKTEANMLKQFFKYLSKNNKAYSQAVKEDLEAYLLSREWKQSTRRSALHSIKRFYGYLLACKAIQHNPAQDLEIHSSKEAVLMTVPSVNEIKAVFKKLEQANSRHAMRNRLMVEFAYGSGLRRTEIATLNLDDINVHNETVHVLGKGRKERVVPLTRRCLSLFTGYVRNIQESRKPLFTSACGTRLCPGAVGVIIKQATGYNPHLFRHACATHMLVNGCGIRYIQEMLGHSRLCTTQIYTNFDKRELRKVVNSRHPCGAG